MPKIAASVIVALGTVACAYRGVPAPNFTTPFDVASADSIRAYITTLDFDKREGAGDDQPLVVGCPDACRIGPEVVIQPEKRTHKNSEASLATGPGRIIARIINRDPKEAYPPLNLAPGDTVYWAVDQVKPESRNRSSGRSLYISARGLRGESKTPVLKKPMHVVHHPENDPWKQALARWVPADSTYKGDGAPGGGASDYPMMRSMTSWNNCRSQSCCGP
jgi:hypothetical protein